MLIDEKPAVYRVWIPKTAGTSIHCATHNSGLPHITINGVLQSADLSKCVLYTTGNVPPRDSVKLEWITRQWVEQAWTFTIIRNPWERFVSAFYYREDFRSQFGNSFSAFIRGITEYPDCSKRARPPRRVSSGWAQERWLLWPDGKEVCDQVLRFESLDGEWPAVAERLGLPPSLSIQNASKHGDYQGYYTAETREAVARHERYVIEKYGYEF